MEPSGPGSNGILLVGEAPSERDDAVGKHFRGETGDLLREHLGLAGIRYSECMRTSAMICHPTKPWTDVNVASCRPTLLRTIDEHKPKVVILLGPATVRSLMPSERGGLVGAHQRWVGFTIPSWQHQAWLCPTWDARQVKRFREDPVVLKLWRDHFRRARDLVAVAPDALDVASMQKSCELIKSPRDARLRLKDLAKVKRGELAFDYESTCLKPDKEGARLLAASFCLDGEGTFAFPIRDVEMAEAMSPVLRNEGLRKIGSNIKHEERWTKKVLGHGVAGWWHDTLQAAHCLDNRRGITSIKFQIYLYHGVPDYNQFVDPFIEEDPKTGLNRLAAMDQEDLLTYNSMDSLCEYLVCKKQRPLLRLEEDA